MAVLIYEPSSRDMCPVHCLGRIFVPFVPTPDVPESIAQAILDPVSGAGPDYRRLDGADPKPAPALPELPADVLDAHLERVEFAQKFLDAKEITKKFNRDNREEA